MTGRIIERVFFLALSGMALGGTTGSGMIQRWNIEEGIITAIIVEDTTIPVITGTTDTTDIITEGITGIR